MRFFFFVHFLVRLDIFLVIKSSSFLCIFNRTEKKKKNENLFRVVNPVVVIVV